jgi:hypothetical protein
MAAPARAWPQLRDIVLGDAKPAMRVVCSLRPCCS